MDFWNLLEIGHLPSPQRRTDTVMSSRAHEERSQVLKTESLGSSLCKASSNLLVSLSFVLCKMDMTRPRSPCCNDEDKAGIGISKPFGKGQIANI